MKFKQKVDFFGSLSSILIGVILLLLSLFNINGIKYLSILIFSLLSIINIIKFILVRKSEDYEGLHTFLCSIIALILSIILDITNIKKLYYVLISWVGFMSLIKLKKMDYYHDRKNKMWKLQAFSFGMFLLVGLLTCINLAHSSSVQIIILGYFFLIYGVLDILDPLVTILMDNDKNIKKR